ncbi:MauE/DoxX family redox-associated membrane protein [Microbacterium sp. B19]|uniref:MauE/DoxX family redox-associated membrane protein n=1 Tax=Microbacterium sp. B19 TaxID=96765 RepID=UPI0003475FD6|nr:MauE/DoxX family redox-associated membrane protein [Microbacterium sp. B19]
MLATLMLPALVVAAVFAASGSGKLLDLRSAPATLRALRLSGLPPRLVVACVAAVEVVLSVVLLLGTGPARVGAAAAALAVTLGFLAIGLRAQVRASTDDCGCFGRLASTRVGPAMTTRNIALTVLAALALLGAVLSPLAPPVALSLVLSPLLGVIVLVSIVAVGVVGATMWSPPTPAAPASGSVPDAALITPEGGVVVPRQRALRGRAQLLLFVRRGCSSCENLISRMTWDRELLETLVDVRLIVPVGDGSPLTAADEGLHADPSGEFAVALGIPGNRPVGVLLTTMGEILQPVAVGGDETATLVDTVLAAAADARAGEGSSTS